MVRLVRIRKKGADIVRKYTFEVSLRQIVEVYLRDAIRHASPETIEHYRGAVGTLSKYLQREAVVSDLNRETFRRFTTYWIETKGRSVVTADDHRRKLNRLAKFAVWLGLLERAETLPPLITTAATRCKTLPDEIRLGLVTAKGGTP